MLTNKEIETLKAIRNTVMHEGGFPSLRKLMVDLNYKSPRSVSLLIEQLIEKGLIEKKNDGSLMLLELEITDNSSAQTVDIPLLGNVACGLPILAEENISAMIPVSVEIAKPNNKYFFLRAKGDSMDLAGINDGDLVLIKQQNTAENGDLVVALVDDEATIKEFHKQQDVVVLKPRSNNEKHQPIILTRNFQVQGVVVKTINEV